MNKYIIRASLIAATVLAAACTAQEEPESPSLEPDYTPVLATIGAETKTSMGPKEAGAYKVHWSENDQIIISTGTKAADKFYYTAASSGSSSAMFIPEDRGSVADFSGGAIAGYPIDDMYLSGPNENSEVYFTIPDTQDYVPGSFSEKAMPMISEVTHEPVLNFRNAAGVIRLLISSKKSDVEISDITISSTQLISGECGYVPATKTIFFDDTMISSYEVMLRCPEGVKISEEATAFHIVVPHQTYSNMSITVTTTDRRQQTFHLKDGKEITVKRSTVSEIPLTLNALEDLGKKEINVEVTSVTFDDIKVKISMKNLSSYFCGVSTKKNFTSDLASGHLLSVLEYVSPYVGPLIFNGSITTLQSDFNDLMFVPGESYVIWFVPYNKTGIYSEEDLTYVEATMMSFTSGGSIMVSNSNLEVDYTSISMDLNAQGAKYIYAHLTTEEALAEFKTERQISDYLVKPGVAGTVLDKSKDVFIRKFLRPGKKMIFLALAIDRSGKYGPLLMQEIETVQLPYSPTTVSIDKDIKKLRESSRLEWSVSGGKASSYRYIFRDSGSYLWTNTLENSTITAQEKMFLEPNLYYITNTYQAYAELSELVPGREYKIAVCAVDGEGVSSVADSWTFIY